MNVQQREWARECAQYLACQSGRDETETSHVALQLLNQVGQEQFKRSIMNEVRRIQQGISAKAPGREFISDGIHKNKKGLINALYTRLVRDRVMPEIYRFVDQAVKPGAFATVLLIAEDVQRIRTPITYDQSEAVEARLVDLIAKVKGRAGAVDRVVASLRAGTFDDLEISSSSSEEEDDEPPRNLRRAVARASPPRVAPAPLRLESSSESESEPRAARVLATPKAPMKLRPRRRKRIIVTQPVYSESSSSEVSEGVDSVFSDEEMRDFIVPDDEAVIDLVNE